MELAFEAELWQHGGEGGWCFVTLPVEVADEVRDVVPAGNGFGSRRVTAEIGESRWQTSLFPERASGSFVLPVKQPVRRANDLLPGDRVRVRLALG
ncbi:MAG TPA: DUF1905 domain-containing protein [Mycobacteriales bacterium]|nr:DUF1905 domain-containing protein [Mycobacteriales bacterium]